MPHYKNELRILGPKRNTLKFDAEPSQFQGYSGAGKQLLERGLRLPTGVETAFFLEALFNSDEPRYKEVLNQIMTLSNLWIFNTVLQVSEGNSFCGAYFAHDSQAQGLSRILSKEDFKERLRGGKIRKNVLIGQDGLTSYACAGTIREGPQEPSLYAQNGLIAASFLPEGAQKLEEVSTKFLEFPKSNWIRHWSGHSDSPKANTTVSKLSFSDFQLEFNPLERENKYSQGIAFGIIEE